MSSQNRFQTPVPRGCIKGLPPDVLDEAQHVAKDVVVFALNKELVREGHNVPNQILLLKQFVNRQTEDVRPFVSYVYGLLTLSNSCGYYDQEDATQMTIINTFSRLILTQDAVRSALREALDPTSKLCSETPNHLAWFYLLAGLKASNVPQKPHQPIRLLKLIRSFWGSLSTNLVVEKLKEKLKGCFPPNGVLKQMEDLRAVLVPFFSTIIDPCPVPTPVVGQQQIKDLCATFMPSLIKFINTNSFGAPQSQAQAPTRSAVKTASCPAQPQSASCPAQAAPPSQAQAAKAVKATAPQSKPQSKP